MNINEFIRNYYDVDYRGQDVNIEDFSNVDEFLLADNHGSPGHSEINSLFINTFSNKNDIVLVEAIRSMQRIEKDEALQSVWLTTQSSIMGWDMGTIEEISGMPLLQQTGNLERKGQILLRKFCDLNFNGNKEEIEKEMIKTLIESTSLLSEVFEKSADLEDMIARTLPERVKSLKDSLIKVKEISSRTFLIVGGNHLRLPDPSDSRFSLGDFYEFLNYRKVVTLFPKSQKVSELGQKRLNVFQPIIMKAMQLYSQ